MQTKGRKTKPRKCSVEEQRARGYEGTLQTECSSLDGNSQATLEHVSPPEVVETLRERAGRGMWVAGVGQETYSQPHFKSELAASWSDMGTCSVSSLHHRLRPAAMPPALW